MVRLKIQIFNDDHKEEPVAGLRLASVSEEILLKLSSSVSLEMIEFLPYLVNNVKRESVMIENKVIIVNPLEESVSVGSTVPSSVAKLIK